MDSHNNTGYTSVKIFCESRMASVNLSTTRKIWTLHKPIVIPTGHDVQMSCSVESASIPLSYYSINETNCKMSFSMQDSNYQTRVAENFNYSVPVGNYSITALLKTLNYEFDENGKNIIKFDYEPNTSKIILYFKRGRLGNSMTAANFFFPCINALDNSIYKLIGISPENNIINFSPHKGKNPVALIYTSGLYISLNNCQNANIDTGVANQTSNILIRVPITQAQNTVLGFFNPTGFKNLLSTNVLASIDLSLLDDNRQLLQLTENVDWSVVLRIDFQRVITESVAPTKINKLRTENI
jgi:hypothetical protein